MLSDRFAHDFWYEEDGQLLQGAEGKLSEIALGTSAIQRVQGLSFDLDVKDFHPAFKEVYVDYLELMMPELGLIQTSPKGDMHGRVLFSESVSVENGKQYHRSLKDLLLADGSSAFTMSYRVPGSLNSKYDDFVVQELRPPQKLDSKHLKVPTAKVCPVGTRKLFVPSLPWSSSITSFTGKRDEKREFAQFTVPGLIPINATTSLSTRDASAGGTANLPVRTLPS